MSKSLFLLACTPLLLGGCLVGAISKERLGRVERLSRFQSKCPTLKLVDSSSHTFRFSGCGSSYVYRCHDRGRGSYGRHSKVEMLDLLITGGMDTDAPCALADVYADGSPGQQPIARQNVSADDDAEAGPQEPPSATPAPPEGWTAPEGVDDPGPVATGETPPLAHKQLPRQPDAAELKRAMSAVQPGVRRCAGAAGRVAVDLRLRPSGVVAFARVRAALPQPTKRCVEGELRKAQVAPFAGSQPLTLAYLFDLR